jgi:S-adenosylmethionine-diacylglycerol 3-amino-3-carboxypropyl transferase
VRYAQAWEDPRTLTGGLSTTGDDRVLAIAAAGDNVFSLLLDGVGSVTAVDLSPAQCALVELKRAALRTLTYEQLLRLAGVRVGADRGQLYLRARSELPAEARLFWDERPALIAEGLVHLGRLEHMWRTFRTRVLPVLHSRSTINAVLEPRTRLQREEFWHEQWNTLRWRTAVRLFFSQRVIAALGRDQAMFEHADLVPGKHYSARAYHALVDLDPATNPFVQYILLGRWRTDEQLPRWLTAAAHAELPDLLDRLDVRCTELEQLAANADPGTWTGAGLSDVFEWMSDDLHERVYRAIAGSCTPGAHLVYWNNLVLRTAPTSLTSTGAVVTDEALGAQLHDADRAFLYRAVRVDRIVDPRAART